MRPCDDSVRTLAAASLLRGDRRAVVAATAGSIVDCERVDRERVNWRAWRRSPLTIAAPRASPCNFLPRGAIQVDDPHPFRSTSCDWSRPTGPPTVVLPPRAWLSVCESTRIVRNPLIAVDCRTGDTWSASQHSAPQEVCCCEKNRSASCETISHSCVEEITRVEDS